MNSGASPSAHSAASDYLRNRRRSVIFLVFLGAVLLYRMRTEVLKREARSSWVRAEVARLVEGRA